MTDRSERKIKIVKNRSKRFSLYIQDEFGNPKDITGWSIIRLKIKHGSGCLTKYAPQSTGINEIQQLDLLLADAGNFKLKFKDEVTAELAFDSSIGDIQTALNALFELSGVVVTTPGASKFDISFEGDDGKRQQALIEVIDSTLSLTGNDIVATVVETTEGEEISGIEVVQESCGHIMPLLSQDDVNILDEGNDQDIDLYVRIGTEDVDLDPMFLREILDVETLGC